MPTLVKIDQLVSDLRQQGKIPAGLDISLTGSAVIGRDHSWAELQSARDTELLTVILVVVASLIVGRKLLAPGGERLDAVLSEPLTPHLGTAGAGGGTPYSGRTRVTPFLSNSSAARALEASLGQEQ